MWNVRTKKLLAATIAVVCLLPFGTRRGAGADAPSATQPQTRPQAETRPSGPSVFKLTLYPSAITKPVLQYRLLPDLTEQEPGDAATLYAIAAKISPGYDDDPDAWSAVNYPEELELPQLAHNARAERLLGLCSAKLRYLDLAGHRTDAHWDEGFRDRGLWQRAPYWMDLKLFANLQTLQARFQISRGELPAALRTMQNDLAMARHMSRDSTLSSMGSNAVIMILQESGFDWVGLEHSPNLYWALSSLPTPFFSLDEVSEKDQAEFFFTIPALRKTRDGELTPEEWSQALRDLIRIKRINASAFLRESDVPPAAGPPDELIQKALPTARDYLVSLGVSREKIEAMPAVQAVGRFFFEQYRDAADDVWGAWQLPYPEAIQPLLRVERLYAREQSEGMPNPFLENLQHTWRPRTYITMSEQLIALMRVVEALRDYTATHDGQPPDRLEQITAVPIPPDPFSGKPFEYTRDGRQAVLLGLAPKIEGWGAGNGYRLEITFAAASHSK